MTVRIEPWRGQAHIAEALANWHVGEWQDIFPNWNVETAMAEFMAQLADSGLPASWLAFDDDVLIGSVSALPVDAPEFKDLPGPWLASLFVRPAYRGQGVARLLIDHARGQVATMGYAQWFLFTEHHQTYYQQLGWQLYEHRLLHRQPVVVMWQDLSVG